MNIEENEQMTEEMEETFNEEEMVKEFSNIEEENEIEASEADDSDDLEADSNLSEGTELETFESADIIDMDFVDDEQVVSIIESILFVSDKPVTINTMKQAFQGTNIKKDKIKKAIENLMIDYAGGTRGISIEEVQGGYQLRSKVDNVEFLKRLQKARPFRLSGPALEVMSIVAYKQPLVKNEVDQIRGVESGHLMRALMDRRLIKFVGKSDLPGKPMLYGTTKYFLEIFGLRNINELPSLSEIDQLIPEGIGDEKEEEKESLSDVSNELGLAQGESYSESEEELGKISEKLAEIDTTTEFFEQEKIRERRRRDEMRAKEIQESIDFEEEVSAKDLRWLENFNEMLAAEAESLQTEAEDMQAEASDDDSIELQSHSQDEMKDDTTESEDLNADIPSLDTESVEAESLELDAMLGESPIDPISEEINSPEQLEDESLVSFDFDDQVEKDNEI